jgi:hypothetical protein
VRSERRAPYRRNGCCPPWCALIAPDVGGLWRTRGVRLVVTDLDLSAGVGPEVRGAAEALLMAIAGRRGVVGELSGPGQGKLAGRIDGC